ncbi:protein ALP1-like isoform X2 [Solenopsis invicta]|nr:protein ALP1-like isoform X2 [Solenopsis invicta]XP_039302964.1 protein ALP1-like isoform X2 [Solenopsis invicta]
MSPVQFDELLAMIEPIVTKVHLTREPLHPGLRLSLTLRYLASGDSMASLHYLYRVGKSTVPKIIAETTEALWQTLQPQVLPPPTLQTWIKIAENFENKWHFPNCVGAIDGKHVTAQCFKNTGSAFYNYKGTFSTVLMGVSDADLRFVYVSIGSAGRESDGGIFQNLDFGRCIETGTLPLPPPKTLPGTNICLPVVFVGDAAFPLLKNLLRPYSGTNLSPEKIIFNYRLSTARRLIENAFGVMSARWRIFRRSIVASLSTVDNIVKSCVVLHNWLRNAELNVLPAQRRYVPVGFVDVEDRYGNVEPGQWRNEEPSGALRGFASNTSRNCTNDAKRIREMYTDYFMKEGQVPWQWNKLPNYQREAYMQ